MGGAELLVMLVLVVGVAAAGLILMIRSRQGRIGYPSCGRCRYDATGSIGEAVRCPECGAAYAEVGIRPPRRSRQGLLAAGIGLTSCAFIMMIGMVLFATIAARTQAARAEAMAARAQAVADLQKALQAQQAQRAQQTLQAPGNDLLGAPGAGGDR